MILIKAWSYFESHILSSQNGLLATYALETLVLCVVNLFHAELKTPLEVLAKFLDYFAHFDWKHWSLTIRGPVKNSQIQDGGEVPEGPEFLETFQRPADSPGFLLSDEIIASDVQLSALILGLKDDNRTGFQLKSVNISDPLSNKNNLGRSVSRSSSYRIARAFRKGWEQFQEMLVSRDINPFFKYTQFTLAEGVRPDVGDMCIPGEFKLHGHVASTLSSRSTDMGRSVSSGKRAKAQSYFVFTLSLVLIYFCAGLLASLF